MSEKEEKPKTLFQINLAAKKALAFSCLNKVEKANQELLSAQEKLSLAEKPGDVEVAKVALESAKKRLEETKNAYEEALKAEQLAQDLFDEDEAKTRVVSGKHDEVTLNKRVVMLERQTETANTELEQFKKLKGKIEAELAESKITNMNMFARRKVVLMTGIAFLVGIVLGIVTGYFSFSPSKKYDETKSSGVLRLPVEKEMRDGIIIDLQNALKVCKESEKASVVVPLVPPISTVEIKKVVEDSIKGLGQCNPIIKTKPKAHNKPKRTHKKKIEQEEKVDTKKSNSVMLQDTKPETEVVEIKKEVTAVHFWGWIHPEATSLNQKTCFTSIQIQGKPSQCSKVEIFPIVSGESEEQWNTRVAEFNGIAVGKKENRDYITKVTSKITFGRVKVN